MGTRGKRAPDTGPEGDHERARGSGARVAVVGPDAAGKSTLVQRLQQAGYDARSCAQDHSYVPDMWRRVSQPDFLVFLDASLEAIARRRAIDWGHEWLDVLHQRLAHARQNCHLYVDTDDMTPEQVVTLVTRALSAAGITPNAED